MSVARWPSPETSVACVPVPSLKPQNPMSPVSVEVTAKNSGADVPPPGGGVATVTSAVPTAAMSALPIVARSSVLLTNVVARLAPPHCTTDDGVKPLPATVSVKLEPPAAAPDGVSDDASGAGAGVTTVTVTGALTAVLPAASWARTVSVCWPSATVPLSQSSEYAGGDSAAITLPSTM